MALRHLKIWHCSELMIILLKGQLPETLETLRISFCEKLESIIEEFHNNKDLYDIYIFQCDKLKSFPEGLETLSSLCRMKMIYCGGFASLPKGDLLDSNFRVQLIGCEKLEALLSGIHTLSSLEIISCPNMSLSEEILPTNLALLAIHCIKQYKVLMEWELHNLTYLTYLDISGGPDGESFQEDDMRITLPHALTELQIEGFSKLKYLSFKDFKDLPSVEYLMIGNFLKLISLPSLPSSLLQLYIYGCPFLEEACKRDEGKKWSKIADTPFVEINNKFISDPEEALQD